MERTYNIPLRRKFISKPRHRRAKVAIRIIKEFLKKHMKSDTVKLGPKLNEAVWFRGIKNPPHHIKVTVVKDSDNVVKAELFGHKYPEPIKQQKKQESGSITERLLNKAKGNSEKQQDKKTTTEKAESDKKQEVKETKNKAVEKKASDKQQESNKTTDKKDSDKQQKDNKD